jgi:hypothetical protein
VLSELKRECQVKGQAIRRTQDDLREGYRLTMEAKDFSIAKWKESPHHSSQQIRDYVALLSKVDVQVKEYVSLMVALAEQLRGLINATQDSNDLEEAQSELTYRQVVDRINLMIERDLPRLNEVNALIRDAVGVFALFVDETVIA